MQDYLCLTQVFNYNPSAHNVYSLASGECDFSNGATELSSDSSPTRVTVDKPGTYWYGCSISGHCDGGMLQKVVVEAGEYHCMTWCCELWPRRAEEGSSGGRGAFM